MGTVTSLHTTLSRGLTDEQRQKVMASGLALARAIGTLIIPAAKLK